MRYRDEDLRHATSRRGCCLSRLLTFLLLLVILAYPFLEPFLLETETVFLTSDALSKDIGQLRIVYLSDIHEGSFYSHGRVQELATKINALNADLVLLGGDYAEDSDSAIAFFQHLPTLRSRYGVYGVLGNHDRTVPESNLNLLRSAMVSAGVMPLVNDVAQVRIGHSTVYLAGIDDVNNGWPDITSVAARVRQSDYVIFLSHSPEAIPDAQRAKDTDGRTGWFDLGLFGHTHGGQIAGLGSLLGISKVSARYEKGWIRENRVDMLISRGVGTSILPIRFLRRPQIHLITIRSSQ